MVGSRSDDLVPDQSLLITPVHDIVNQLLALIVHLLNVFFEDTCVKIQLLLSVTLFFELVLEGSNALAGRFVLLEDADRLLLLTL